MVLPPNVARPRSTGPGSIRGADGRSGTPQNPPSDLFGFGFVAAGGGMKAAPHLRSEQRPQSAGPDRRRRQPQTPAAKMFAALASEVPLVSGTALPDRAVPSKFHVHDSTPMAAMIHPTEDAVRFRAGQFETRTFPSKNPKGRKEAQLLGEVLDAIDHHHAPTTTSGSKKARNFSGVQEHPLVAKAGVDVELIREEFVALDIVFSEAVRQTRTECKERADVMDKLRAKYAELVASMLTHVFRNLHSAENFTQFQLQANKERGAHVSEIVTLKKELAQTQEKLDAAKAEHEGALADMRGTMETAVANATKAEKHAEEKAKQAEDFQCETQDWYDWQMKHLEEVAEQATMQNEMLLRAKTELHDKVSGLEKTNQELLDGIINKTFLTKATQSDVTGAVVPSGSASASGGTMPLGGGLAISGGIGGNGDTEDTSMPVETADYIEVFDEREAQGTLQYSRKAAVHRLVQEGRVQYHSWVHLLYFGKGEIVEPRALDHWITDIYDSKLEQDREDAFANKPCMLLGPFIVVHFRKRFGLRVMAENHIVDLIHSVRTLRKNNSRLHLFGELAGIDATLPPAATEQYLRMHAYLKETTRGSLDKLDSEKPVVWDKLRKIEDLVDHFFAARGTKWIEGFKGQVSAFKSTIDTAAGMVERVNRDKVLRFAVLELIGSVLAQAHSVADTMMMHAEVDDDFGARSFNNFVNCLNPAFGSRDVKTMWRDIDGKSVRKDMVTAEQLLEAGSKYQIEGGSRSLLTPTQVKARELALTALDLHWLKWRVHIEARILALQKRTDRVTGFYRRMFEAFATLDEPLAGWVCLRTMMKDLGLTAERYAKGPPPSLQQHVRHMMIANTSTAAFKVAGQAHAAERGVREVAKSRSKLEGFLRGVKERLEEHSGSSSDDEQGQSHHHHRRGKLPATPSTPEGAAPRTLSGLVQREEAMSGPRASQVEKKRVPVARATIKR